MILFYASHLISRHKIKAHLTCIIHFQFIEKFHEVKEATRTATKPLNGTTPTTSASASPVAARSAATVGSGAVVTTTDNQVRQNYNIDLLWTKHREEIV